MSDFLRSYLTVGIFGLIAVALVSALLGISAVLRPTRPQAQKYINYESGVDPVGSGWGQSNIRYYILALLFVMFEADDCKHCKRFYEKVLNTAVFRSFAKDHLAMLIYNFDTLDGLPWFLFPIGKVHSLKSCSLEFGKELVFPPGTGNATRPERRIILHVFRHVFIGDNVADRRPSALLENTVNFLKKLGTIFRLNEV